MLVVEDGPTLTHGEMAYGAGWVAAQRFGAAEIVDPRPFAVGLDRRRPTPSTRRPARSCRPWATATEQMRELEQTINRAAPTW